MRQRETIDPAVLKAIKEGELDEEYGVEYFFIAEVHTHALVYDEKTGHCTTSACARSDGQRLPIMDDETDGSVLRFVNWPL